MNKTYITIGVAVVIILGLGYLLIRGGSTSGTSTMDVEMMNSEDGQRVLVLLNQMQMLNIDTNIFSDTAYLTLRDNTVRVPPQMVGRPNPFAPVPGMIRYQGTTNR